MSAQLGRRDFLRGIGVAGASLALASCARSSRLGAHRDRLLPVEAGGDRLLRRAHRPVPPDPVPRPGAPRRRVQPGRDVRAGVPTRHRLPQLQLRGLPLRGTGSAQRPRRHARGRPDPRRAQAAHRRHGHLPGPHQRHPVLAHGGGRALQPADLRGPRPDGPDHLGRAHRRVRRARGRGRHPALQHVQGPVDDRAGSLRLLGRRHGRHHDVLQPAQAAGHQRRPRLPRVVREAVPRAGPADAAARPVLAGQRGEPRLRGREPRVRERRGGHVPAGSVGDRGDREVEPRPRRRRVPPADDGRPGGPQGAGQHRPRAVDPRGLHEEGGGARVPDASSCSPTSSTPTTPRRWASA